MAKAKRTIENDLAIDVAEGEGMVGETQEDAVEETVVESVAEPVKEPLIVEIKSPLKDFLHAQGAVVNRSPEFSNVLCVKYKGQAFDINENNDKENIRNILAARGFDEDAVSQF